MNIEVQIEPTSLKRKDRLSLVETVVHCQQLVELLRALDGPRDSRVDFELISMSKNSPLNLALSPTNLAVKNPRPLPSVSRHISSRLEFVLGGFDPDNLSETDVNIVSKVASTARKLARERRQMSVVIDGKTFIIGKRVADRLEKFLNFTTTELGAITGNLEIVRNRKQKTFVLFPTIGPSSIVCEFEEKHFEKIIESLKQRQLVEVEGRIVQRRKSRYPHLIYVEDLRPIDDGDDVSLLAFRGSLKGQTPPEGGWISAW